MDLERTILRRDGVSLVVETPAAGLPAVLHWGADLGDLDDALLDGLALATTRQTPPGTLDAAWRLSLLPQDSEGWAGRPGILLDRGGRPVFPRWTSRVAPATSRDSLVVEADDAAAGLRLTTRLGIGAGGVVTVDHALANVGDEPLTVHQLEATLPVPTRADHLTSFTGRWTREKSPRTTEMPRGSTTRQTRRGRVGHDSPHVVLASAGAPRDRRGDVWAVHLGWSADVTYRVDRTPEHPTLLGAGELLRPGEVVLAPGEEHVAPTTYFAWSADGLDGVAGRFHTYLRARPQHPRSPRPLVLNTWEAVYFDHDPARVEALARRAAEVGVERFVLDDGWFHDRRDDTRGLGDWWVDRTVWPDGLGPLADLVHGLGMELGLWFEPEMVNLDSDLARAHPEWLLHSPTHLDAPAGLSWRSQHVLDLAHPDAYAHVRDAMSAVIGELGVDFVKWDHNRDLVETLHDGRPGTHVQTRAAYALMAELKERHPGLEIESCSSGGARTDLGVMAVADRVWASDSNDPVERQDIQRWTQLLLPPELVGGHVGPGEAHSSGRTTDLSYRLATSLMGSAGFEWDLLGCTPDEVATITAWAALYRELRHVLHTGTAVHADVVDPALRVVGAVLPDRSEGVWTIATVATLEDALPERVHLHGLDPDLRYTVRVRDEIGLPRHGWVTPPWLTTPVVVSGRVLAEVGLQVPALWPAQALVVHVTAAA